MTFARWLLWTAAMASSPMVPSIRMSPNSAAIRLATSASMSCLRGRRLTSASISASPLSNPSISAATSTVVPSSLL